MMFVCSFISEYQSEDIKNIYGTQSEEVGLDKIMAANQKLNTKYTSIF